MKICIGIILIVIGVTWFIYSLNEKNSAELKYYSLARNIFSSICAIVLGILLLLDKISF